jgi:hypothetical protein
MHAHVTGNEDRNCVHKKGVDLRRYNGKIRKDIILAEQTSDKDGYYANPCPKDILRANNAVMAPSPREGQGVPIATKVGSVHNINVARNLKADIVQSIKEALGLTSTNATGNLCAEKLRRIDYNGRMAYLNYLREDGAVDGCLPVAYSVTR